jgi:hypothetical protein
MSEQLLPIRITHRLSAAAVRVFPIRLNDQAELTASRQATGCLWKADGVHFLITNWHNVTGWDPVRDCALDASGFTPNFVETLLLVEHPKGYGLRARVVPLFDSSGRATWLEHPRFARRVDVVAVPLEVPEGLATLPVNRYPHWFPFDLQVGDDAFVLGFPHGMMGGPLTLPIWKRASLATEPNVDLDDLPKMLIDTATRGGMSGSPAIAVRRGFANLSGRELGPKTAFGAPEQFLGIYSGRVGEDVMGVQLGIVWKAAVIQEIIDAGVRGRHPTE